MNYNLTTEFRDKIESLLGAIGDPDPFVIDEIMKIAYNAYRVGYKEGNNGLKSED